MCRIHFEHLYTLPLICYDRLKMASIEVKQISSLCKTRMHATVSVYEKYANQRLRIYVGHMSFCMFMRYASELRNAHACRKNLWTPATISWWLFAHFCTRKRAASVGLRHICMNVSVGLSDTYTTLSLLSRMFLCCKSQLNIRYRSQN